MTQLDTPGDAGRSGDDRGHGGDLRAAALADPAMLRGLTQARFGRRGLLRFAGLAGGATLLAACGVSGEKKDSAGDDAASFWRDRTKAGTLDFANWPLYMDVGSTDSDHPSLDVFTKKTGIKVTYREVIQDNESFFAQIRPTLAAGKSIGYDLMVLTNGITLSRVMQLGYLAPLDHARLPTFAANASPNVRNPTYDPGNAYTIPWQSGLTGIAYDPAKTGREITSYNDLFDPKFAGKVGMFGDNQDLPNLALLGIGVEPAKSTPDDWKKAAAKLTAQRRDGIVRKYYDQSYIDALAGGDLWISMAWSGDVYQQIATGTNLKFVVPSEGGLLWTDNMCIPKTAPHPVDAISYMDFVYRPEIAGMLTEYINYITPVPTAAEHVPADLAKSTLLFPSADELSRVSRFRVLTTAEETEWNRIFQPVYQS
ncbi:spermidine/putrescine ABC transporter substrate-binding protein [Frankia sp. AiPs1]|uniref:ABC transporter substrate-binding protein n=1 Tax=Frankia sp. AiPs1 TaxID=573493 RepID=UPI0020444F23|nr:spermidine/putrescine ABC transporter substrate-binding protein [Frankia sp. AiPs1]MCM3922741.1 spermidine/putrescine ABC transporter substrate-binding protein [Frankia sp. AiPs1]